MNRRVAFTLALALVFTGVVGTHAEAAIRLPDLIVSAVSAPSTAQPGMSIALSASIKNQGRASASTVQAAFYLTTSASSITGATLLGTQNVGSLSAGASVTLATTLPIPSSTSSGTFYVVAVADPSNAIKESKETNNTRASGAIAVTVPASTQMTIWVADALTRVQPTDPPGTSTTATITAARNEYEAVQVLVRAPDLTNLSGVNVAVSDLVGPGTLPKSAIALYRAHYIPVRQQSAFGGWVSPNPPGDWADALIPATVPGGTYPSFPFSVPAGHNQPVWVEVYVPKGTPAGTYTGTVTVTADGVAPVTVPLTLTVWGFTLPDRPALASDFGIYDTWFYLAANSSVGASQPTLQANLYAALNAHRLGLGVASVDPTTDAWMQTHRHILAPPTATDTELQSLKSHFDVNGWGDFLAYYIADEPQTQTQYDAIKATAPRWRGLGIPTMTTIQNSTAWSALDGAIDIWVPVFYECVSDAAQIQAKLAKGEKVWSYAAGLQPPGAPTWLLDYDLIHFRIPAWLNYRHGQTGLLYWATAYWEAGPWSNAVNENGEGVLFYPGDAVGAPNAAIPSARLKALRDGVEDYDYLTLLAQLGAPGLATQLAATLAPAWDNWSHDLVALTAAREQAALRILELGGT